MEADKPAELDADAHLRSSLESFLATLTESEAEQFCRFVVDGFDSLGALPQRVSAAGVSLG